MAFQFRDVIDMQNPDLVAETTHSSESKAVSRLTVFGFAPAAILLAVAFGYFHCHMKAWLASSDAYSYISVSKHIYQNIPSESSFDERMFLGWPILIGAGFDTVGPEIACIILALLFAAAVPSLLFWLTRDINIAIASCLWPVWILQTTLGMSEPAYLFFILLSLLLVQHRNFATAGMCIGFAAMIRPLALFPWIGVLFDLWRKGESRSVLAKWIVVSGLFAGMTIPLNLYLYGSPLRQFERYSTLPNTGEEAMNAGLIKPGDGHFGLPFKSLVETPMKIPVPKWKIGYVYFHVLVALMASINAILFWKENARQQLWSIWAILNTTFIVSTGPYWGFHTFDRYFIWAVPAYVVLLRRYLPKSQIVWCVLAVVATMLAILARWSLLTHIAPHLGQ